MMNIKNILSIAALALVGAIMTGCSSEDKLGDAQTAGKGNVVTQKITVNLDDGKGTTRALAADGVKTFAVGDKIAIVYTNTSDATVKAESSALTATDITSGGKSAMFTVSLTNPKASAAVTYIYPAAMANADGTVNYAALATQDGTLSKLASDFDLATGTGTLSATGALPTTSVALANPLAILALTVKDNGDNDITSAITSLSVGDGTNIYAVNRTAAPGPIYVAIKPTASTDIAINASDGTTNYYKALPSTTYAAGNGYSQTLAMRKIIDLSTLTSDYTAQDGDVLTGTLGANVQISIAAPVAPATTTSITLDGVSINADGTWATGNHAGITPLGDATIILKDGTTNTVKGFHENYPGIFAAAGNTLTIQGETAGTGTLTASSNGKGAGIGGGDGIACGNIAIQGGTVTATGGEYAAGIGGGNNAACGTITIANTVTSVTALKGATNPNDRSIGAGGSGATCGTVTIGGTVYWDGSAYQNGGNTHLAKSKLVYPTPIVDLSTIASILPAHYFVNGDVILTGTPPHDVDFSIIYDGNDYEVTLDNVNPEGAKNVKVLGYGFRVNLKLKGTNRLLSISNNGKPITIGEAAAGGTLIVKDSNTGNLLNASTVTINGGTVKVKSTSPNHGASYLCKDNLVVNGGAVYLAATSGDPAVKNGATITVGTGVTLYGWSGSAWTTIASGLWSGDTRYITTDNSATPDDWNW